MGQFESNKVLPRTKQKGETNRQATRWLTFVLNANIRVWQFVANENSFAFSFAFPNTYQNKTETVLQMVAPQLPHRPAGRS